MPALCPSRPPGLRPAPRVSFARGAEDLGGHGTASRYGSDHSEPKELPRLWVGGRPHVKQSNLLASRVAMSQVVPVAAVGPHRVLRSSITHRNTDPSIAPHLLRANKELPLSADPHHTAAKELPSSRPHPPRHCGLHGAVPHLTGAKELPSSGPHLTRAKELPSAGPHHHYRCLLSPNLL